MNISKRLFPAVICLSVLFMSQTGDVKAQTVAAASPGEITRIGQSDYDPLDVPDAEVQTLELTIKDAERDREFPVLAYLPSSTDPAPVIIHSHGLGGQKETSPFLGKHWAGRGYVAIFLQHPGSDDTVWRDVPPMKIMTAMKKAASGQNLVLRMGDVEAAIDQLEKWNVDAKSPLKGRLDLKHIGMSGHSFGAVTTQNVSGQKTFGGNKADPRISAAIPMSPSVPRIGDPVRAFEEVKIPWLCMTGTKDEGIIGGATAESRLGVFKALPVGDKYQLVLHDAEHLAFTESSRKRSRRKMPERNPNHHPAIKAITTAFWDTYLGEDETAKAWITSSESIRSVLESKDRWQSK